MPSTIIRAGNVCDALKHGLGMILKHGVKMDSRNGPVLKMPGPVVTEYMYPQERLVFDELRDANHVFHLMETIWMLAGGSNVDWLLRYNSSFGQFAEADGVQHGAYGRRWRVFFNGFDQIPLLVNELRVPNNRRAVLAMWSPEHDLGAAVKDVPCNTHIYFDVDDQQRLNMTVCCRSNDMMWGAYGANAVHFSMLQELIALELGVRIGTYYQVSNNFHMYTEFGPGQYAEEMHGRVSYNPYMTEETNVIPLLATGELMWEFLDDCQKFVSGNAGAMRTFFMRRVALPLSHAYLSRKAGRDDYADILSDIPTCDWKLAFQKWAHRRENKGSK
jgi:thymidylate synthase